MIPKPAESSAGFRYARVDVFVSFGIRRKNAAKITEFVYHWQFHIYSTAVIDGLTNEDLLCGCNMTSVFFRLTVKPKRDAAV